MPERLRVGCWKEIDTWIKYDSGTEMQCQHVSDLLVIFLTHSGKEQVVNLLVCFTTWLSHFSRTWMAMKEVMPERSSGNIQQGCITGDGKYSKTKNHYHLYNLLWQVFQRQSMVSKYLISYLYKTSECELLQRDLSLYRAYRWDMLLTGIWHTIVDVAPSWHRVCSRIMFFTSCAVFSWQAIIHLQEGKEDQTKRGRPAFYPQRPFGTGLLIQRYIP